jgi:hypothetical protein
LAQEQVLNTPYVSKIWMTLIANAFNLGDKEWGLHLLKKFPFRVELALLRTAVKSSYKKILFIVSINARSAIVHSLKVDPVVSSIDLFWHVLHQ